MEITNRNHELRIIYLKTILDNINAYWNEFNLDETSLNIIRNWFFYQVKNQDLNLYHELLELIFIDGLKKLYWYQKNKQLDYQDIDVLSQVEQIKSIKEFEKYVFDNSEFKDYSDSLDLLTFDEIKNYIEDVDNNYIYPIENEDELRALEEFEEYNMNNEEDYLIDENQDEFDKFGQYFYDQHIEETLFSVMLDKAGEIIEDPLLIQFNYFQGLNQNIVKHLPLYQSEKIYYFINNVSYKYDDLLKYYLTKINENSKEDMSLLVIKELALIINDSKSNTLETLYTIVSKYYYLTKYLNEFNLLYENSNKLIHLKIIEENIENFIKILHNDSIILSNVLENVLEFDAFQIAGKDKVIIYQDEFEEFIEEKIDSKIKQKFINFNKKNQAD